MQYTPEQYRRMEMEKQAGPLANQVFQPVQVTQVPPPPRAQEPQITPQQQQQPGIGQQFGQAMATKMITKGVDAVTGLPIFTSLGFKGGNKVPSWKEYQKMQGSMGTPYGKEKAKDWYINKSKEQMNVAPSSSPSPSYAEEGMRVRMPLAKPIEMDESYITKGMPKQLRPPLATDEWANYTQKLPMNTDTFYVKQGKQKPSEESYWQKAERTGLFGVPGTQNVYVDPGKQTIAYQREDVKPFTWMWNKGRNFLGFGAPLAERSE
jgi:hypothetical protein